MLRRGARSGGGRLAIPELQTLEAGIELAQPHLVDRRPSASGKHRANVDG